MCFIRHTAIVLLFDGTPICTIDYGQEGGRSGLSGHECIQCKVSSPSKSECLPSTYLPSTCSLSTCLPSKCSTSKYSLTECLFSSFPNMA